MFSNIIYATRLRTILTTNYMWLLNMDLIVELCHFSDFNVTNFLFLDISSYISPMNFYYTVLTTKKYESIEYLTIRIDIVVIGVQWRKWQMFVHSGIWRLTEALIPLNCVTASLCVCVGGGGVGGSWRGELAKFYTLRELYTYQT